MIVSSIEKIKSPLIVTVTAVFVSEIVFILISLIFLDSIPFFGIVVSFFIPIFSAYPVSSIMIKNHSKIEEQKRELEHLNKINQRLFSTITHDIRSPISSVSMLIDLLQSDTISVEESKTQLTEISSNIDVLLQFLDEILKWSKHQIDKKPLEPEYFDAQEVIDSTLTLYKVEISRKSLRINLQKLSAIIYADKGSYSFAFRNVMHNAIKFTPKGGSIDIMVLEDDVKIITEVKDSGIGIEKDKVSRIFNNEETISAKGTNNEDGTGFGLRTTIEYLEIQNGTLEIDSKPGSGTRIVISLPKPN